MWAQGASQTAYVGESGHAPLIGIDGLLAAVAHVRRLREARAGQGGGGGSPCLLMQRCPPVSGPVGGVPCWEVFPEVNRALVARLLGLLAGRMMTQVALAGGGGGGERDERAGRAVRAAGGQGPAMAT